MIIAIRAAGLLLLPILWLQAAQAADPGGSRFIEEVSKQEKIYQSRGDRVPEGYITDRSLLSYAHTLSSGFDRALADLGPQDRWLDIGAGEGQAILDYFTSRYDLMHAEGQARRGKKARAVAISIEDRRTPLWQQEAARLGENKIQYFQNKRLRDYSPQELGRFQLITDVTGGFSYTTDLSLFMEKVLGFLKLNGSFYTVLVDVRPDAGTGRPFFAEASFLTEIKKADGSDVKVCSWLKSITCVEVACESKAHWKPPIEAFHVRKICNDVTVPALRPVHFEAGTPPERRFQSMN
jgi:SAM-dependent methyltransferase